LGPTVDDPTREAVAITFGVELEFRNELWQQIIERFKSFGKIPTENNRRQAYIPDGAIAIENPVGTAPAFHIEHSGKIIICLPGVPHEMKHLYETRVENIIKKKFDFDGVIHTRIVHTTGIGESTLDERIGDLEEMENPTIGLAAHPGQVDIRVTAKARTKEDADLMILPVIQDLRNRIGGKIYGIDKTTLSTAVKSISDKTDRKLELFLDSTVENWEPMFEKTGVFTKITGFIGNDTNNLNRFFSLYNEKKGQDWIPLLLMANDSENKIRIYLHSNGELLSLEKNLHNREKTIDPWLTNVILGYIWEILQDNQGEK
jgi:molybdopterin-biosynthesis enzyme MoeA-like protein